MLNKKFYLYIYIFLILGNTAVFAADFVVPAIKAPYSINDADFDNTGDYFAYEVNGTVYVRDSLSLILKDSYSKNANSVLTPFYNSPARVDYPKIKAISDGNQVTIYSQKNASSQIEKKETLSLPAKVKSAAVNKAQTHIAFLSDDGNAYVYDIANQNVTMKAPYNSSSSGISFTRNNKVLFADSTKSAGLYSINGQKTRTYTAAGTIKSVNLSTDEETVVISDTSGTLNFYNAGSSAQIGYVPNLGSKYIKEVKLSKDSRRILVTGENNTLYISPVQDVLFSQNTVAPNPKQFVINYNALNPKDKSGNEVTEFGITEFKTDINDTDAEYILSTQEKKLGKQTFDLDEEKKPGESIIISNQPEQAYFPPSYIEADREALFTNKKNVEENQVNITEFKQPKNYPVPEYTPPETTSVYKQNPAATVKQTTTQPQQTNAQPAPKVAVVPVQPATTVIVQEQAEPQKTKAELRAELKAQKEAEKQAAKLAKEEEKRQKAAEKKAEKKEKADTQENPFKKIKEFFERDDIKTYYKDGHGILANMGLYYAPLNNTTFTNGWLFTQSYRNYNLIQPFYFGGSIDTCIGLPSSDFKYKYYTDTGSLRNPNLISINIYSPFGFCIYPLKNSLEIYGETGLGVSLHQIWDGNLNDQTVISQMFTGLYTNVKLGVAWDFLNLSTCFYYDVITGFSLGIEVGAVINIGGSRTIGSTIVK